MQAVAGAAEPGLDQGEAGVQTGQGTGTTSDKALRQLGPATQQDLLACGQMAAHAFCEVHDVLRQSHLSIVL